MGKKVKKGPALAPAFQLADDDDSDGLLALIKADKGQLELKNGDGWGLLHQAAYSGSLDVVLMLIKQGAPVSALCKVGDTALHYASAQSHAEVIAALARAGAPLELRDKDGETPMDVAGNRTIKKLLEALIAKAEAAGQDTGRNEEDEDYEEVDEDELNAEDLAALHLAEKGAEK
mmetsp:Transcript_16723/g.28694  ORF Transcript_16723/g.28694 Transcript_16723/m.28694 type:complete len:175 (-) Transcript_16723:478-1002(-)|eukprot:CAMPEP_0119107642 /NCGR_PEP_ID=MMETSP1180-20130426/11519_1 /TAXON_ID=3052 ORGANISM="Chlamydomonas cf sp, Strain CCMP681" /NCGR_SAMPLE_ID=MMETSP1180 /ASSEMBLY_ACC=CAM_ASM_000741 /LENGTH=174 /DNA_ID=CAMNT_0007093159 /DNA_START=36 /DNA_END=560 /DNA_ORIENTATION=+